MTIVHLKKGKEKKILNKYPWIFKDEVKEVLKDREDLVCNVFSYNDNFLGKAFINKHSNKYLYMLTNTDEKIDYTFFKRRILEALKLREKYYNKPFYRLINAESDFLPGLIIDRYGDYFSVQIRISALENLKNELLKILVDIFNPRGIYERSDFENLQNENLKRNAGILYGEIPDKITIEENGIKFLVDIKNGQKTGFFFDQRESRKFLQNISLKEKNAALDLYTYTGSFALVMAKNGLNVDAVDKSTNDIELAKQNAKINNLNVRFIVADALEYIKNTLKTYDVIIIDPPSLIKSRNQVKWAKNFLKDLIRHSIKHINDKGIIGFCSCAYYINNEIMTEVLRMASGDAGAYLRIIQQTFQSYDHPWILQIPESLYLKCFWLEVNK